LSDLLKRKGIFKVTRDLIENDPEGVLKVLKDVLIVDIDKEYITNTLTYKGYSKHFDLIKEEEKIPNYIANVETIYNGFREKTGIAVEWYRENEYKGLDIKTMFGDIQESLKRLSKE